MKIMIAKGSVKGVQISEESQFLPDHDAVYSNSVIKKRTAVMDKSLECQLQYGHQRAQPNTTLEVVSNRRVIICSSFVDKACLKIN